MPFDFQQGGTAAKEADDWVTPSAQPAHQAVDDWISPPSAAQSAPESTGVISAFGTGLARGAEEFGTTAKAVTGAPIAPPESPKTVGEQPVELGDLIHPSRLAQKIAMQLGESAGPMGAGIAAGAATTAATVELGPFAPIAGLGAGAIAYGVTSAVQQLGPIYAGELAKDPKDPEGAWNRSLGKAAETGAFGTLGWAAFGVAPFSNMVKNLLFQAFVVQPGVGVAEKATQNVQEGKPTAEGLGDAYAAGVAGSAIPILGVEGAKYAGRRIAGQPAETAPSVPPPSPTAQAPAAGIPPAVAPAIGDTVHIGGFPDGPHPATVVGFPQPDVVELQHADKSRELMTVPDLAARQVPAPEQSPVLPPAVPAEEAPPAAASISPRAEPTIQPPPATPVPEPASALQLDPEDIAAEKARQDLAATAGIPPPPPVAEVPTPIQRPEDAAADKARQNLVAVAQPVPPPPVAPIPPPTPAQPVPPPPMAAAEPIPPIVPPQPAPMPPPEAAPVIQPPPTPPPLSVSPRNPQEKEALEKVRRIFLSYPPGRASLLDAISEAAENEDQRKALRDVLRHAVRETSGNNWRIEALNSAINNQP